MDQKETIITGGGGSESYIKGRSLGGIFIDEAGHETYYSPEDLRQKEIIDRLDKIIQLLVEQKSSI